MFRLNFIALKIFIFLLCLTLAISEDGEEVTDATDATDATTDKTPKTSTAVAPVKETIDAGKCNKKRTECCGQYYLGQEDDLVKCMTLHQSKLPQQGDKDPAKLLKFISCFVECLYKQRKYIGKGDNVNMKMVKSDAEKLFPDRPKERDYHVEMYDFCRKDANGMYNLIKLNPAGKVLLKDACKPYFTFVFLCNAEYHKKHRCPYFRWQGQRKTDSEQLCADDKQKCYELDGILT